MKFLLNSFFSALFILLLILLSTGTLFSGPEDSVYINYFIENGSPLEWTVNRIGDVRIQLLYDHERNSPNRASIHWNFLVEAEKGSDQILFIKGFENIWVNPISVTSSNLR